MVFERLFKRRRHPAPTETVYDAIVEQARHPAFYTGYGIVDGFEERFELLVLHAHLVIRRLTDGGGGGFAQALFDAMFLDMDRTLRAMGVGDMSVGKRVKDMIRAYYGRTGAYETALAEETDDSLALALARNVFGNAEDLAPAQRLARQVRLTVAELAAQPTDTISNGVVRFPNPEALA